MTNSNVHGLILFRLRVKGQISYGRPFTNYVTTKSLPFSFFIGYQGSSQGWAKREEALNIFDEALFFTILVYQHS